MGNVPDAARRLARLTTQGLLKVGAAWCLAIALIFSPISLLVDPAHEVAYANHKNATGKVSGHLAFDKKNGLANVNSTATVNAWWWDTQARRWQSLGSQTINGAANPLCPWGWVNQMCFEFTGVPRNHKVYVTVKYQGDKTVRNRQKTLGSWRDLDMGGFTDK